MTPEEVRALSDEALTRGRCGLLVGTFARLGWGIPCGVAAEYELTMGGGPTIGVCAEHARTAEEFMQRGTVERPDGGYFSRGEVVLARAAQHQEEGR